MHEGSLLVFLGHAFRLMVRNPLVAVDAGHIIFLGHLVLLARALKKGETCADCHSDEAADMGKKIATGQKLEPTPIPG